MYFISFIRNKTIFFVLNLIVFLNSVFHTIHSAQTNLIASLENSTPHNLCVIKCWCVRALYKYKQYIFKGKRGIEEKVADIHNSFTCIDCNATQDTHPSLIYFVLFLSTIIMKYTEIIHNFVRKIYLKKVSQLLPFFK